MLPFCLVTKLIWNESVNYFYFLTDGSDSKESACDAGDPSSIPGSERSHEKGMANPLQYSCPENPEDRGYSPRDHKESDTVEQLTLCITYIYTIREVSAGGKALHSFQRLIEKDAFCSIFKGSLFYCYKVTKFPVPIKVLTKWVKTLYCEFL